MPQIKPVYYAPGQWKACCDACGRKFKSDELRQDWKNLYKCVACWEPRHPQDFVRAKPEAVAIPWSRHCDANFVEVTAVEYPVVPRITSSGGEDEYFPNEYALDFTDLPGTPSNAAETESTGLPVGDVFPGITVENGLVYTDDPEGLVDPILGHSRLEAGYFGSSSHNLPLRITFGKNSRWKEFRVKLYAGVLDGGYIEAYSNTGAVAIVELTSGPSYVPTTWSSWLDLRTQWIADGGTSLDYLAYMEIIPDPIYGQVALEGLEFRMSP